MNISYWNNFRIPRTLKRQVALICNSIEGLNL